MLIFSFLYIFYYKIRNLYYGFNHKKMCYVHEIKLLTDIWRWFQRWAVAGEVSGSGLDSSAEGLSEQIVHLLVLQGKHRVAACLVLTQKQKPEQLQKDPKQRCLPASHFHFSQQTTAYWLADWLAEWLADWVIVDWQWDRGLCDSSAVYSKICSWCLSVLSVYLTWLSSECMKEFSEHIDSLMLQCLL